MTAVQVSDSFGQFRRARSTLLNLSGTIGGATMITVAAAATGGNGEWLGPGSAEYSQEPGAAVQITITDSADPPAR